MRAEGVTGLNNFKQELLASGYIHLPLPLHEEKSLEAEGARKTVLKSRALRLNQVKCETNGQCAVEADGQEIAVRTSLYYDCRPHGDLELGDCSFYGEAGIRCQIDGENWEEFNRISFSIHVEVVGVRHVCGRILFENDGAIKVPDRYFREGAHAMNLIPGREERIRLEIPNLPRDHVVGISFLFYLGGCETDAALGNTLSVCVSDICLEKIEKAETAIGWLPDSNEIAYCFSGYRLAARKTAVILGYPGEAFQVINENEEIIYRGTAQASGFQNLSILDFTPVAVPGRYRLIIGNASTDWFDVGNQIWLPSIWKTINFLFCERCGFPVPTIHQACHRDIVAHHEGRSFVFNGGWHDAGDLSQQLIQSAEVTWSLFELAAKLPDEQMLLRQRLREEGLWGLDYVLKSRFGDGYRATSVGTATWSRGFMGDQDDISARVHNNAYENYLCAAVECFCAVQVRSWDQGLANATLRAAEADYGFAEDKFRLTGFAERPPIYWEHSWMTSESVFMATAALAASLLYSATRKERYCQDAASALEYVTSCQQRDAAGPLFPEGGFFRRSPGSPSIVHFNHQARYQIYAQALCAALEAMPDHCNAPEWKNALQRHAAYYRRLMEHASPYGMIPAGLYRLEERDDQESFFRQHLLTGEEAYEQYADQLFAGKDVGDGFFLRQFPVWFSFRGNNAVLLSMAKAAAICGNALCDESLLSAAEQQLRWNTGLNPFRQSMMYGEGKRYAQQYAAMSGDAAGELPVGIQTLGDADIPYWPQMNNATYKEVWTTSAARWLSVMSELL